MDGTAQADELEDEGDQKGAADTGEVEREEHESLQLEDAADQARRHEGADQERIDRQARRTGHQRRDHDRDQAVAGDRDGARGHDARDRAGEGRQQRNERATGQADHAHQPVEEEGGARQVARILEHEDEEEEDEDLRQEDEHAAGAGEHAVDQEARERSGRQDQAQLLGDGTDAGLQEVHDRPRPGEDTLEHREEHDAEQQRPEDRVQHDPVDAIRQARPVITGEARGGEDAVDLAGILGGSRRGGGSDRGGGRRTVERAARDQPVDGLA